MRMEKKNEYVITIGFNKKLEEHRKVAGILNGMGRTKAQYIVNAVIAYEQVNGQTEQMDHTAVNYEQIKKLVRQAIIEYDGEKGFDDVNAILRDHEKSMSGRTSEVQKTDIGEDTWAGIMDSLNAFRCD